MSPYRRDEHSWRVVNLLFTLVSSREMPGECLHVVNLDPNAPFGTCVVVARVERLGSNESPLLPYLRERGVPETIGSRTLTARKSL